MAANPTKYRYLTIDSKLFDGVQIQAISINGKSRNSFYKVPQIPDIVLIKVEHSGNSKSWAQRPVCYLIIDKDSMCNCKEFTWGQRVTGYGYNSKMKLGLHDLVLWGSETVARERINNNLEPDHQKNLFDNRRESLVERSAETNGLVKKHIKKTEYFRPEYEGNDTIHITTIADLQKLL